MGQTQPTTTQATSTKPKFFRLENVLLFLIGLFVGALLATAGFLIYNKVTANDTYMDPAAGGQQPPEMPSNDGPQGGQQPPEMPDQSNGSGQQPPAKPEETNN